MCGTKVQFYWQPTPNHTDTHTHPIGRAKKLMVQSKAKKIVSFEKLEQMSGYGVRQQQPQAKNILARRQLDVYDAKFCVIDINLSKGIV